MKLNFPKNTKYFEFGNNFDLEKKFVESLYTNEPFPIFEQNIFHVLSYLSFKNTIYGVSGTFGRTIVCISDEKTVFLFTPVILNYNDFIDFIDFLKIRFVQSEVKIQNVSEKFIKNVIEFTGKHYYKVIVRSPEEAVYDVDLLTKLEGKSFSGLRQSKNKLLNNSLLKFENISEVNFDRSIAFLTKWQKYQGFKYFKNKYEKEKALYSKFIYLSQLDHSLIFQIGSVNNADLSIVALIKSCLKKDWGIIYVLKGLNRKEQGGLHGITDATYCYIFGKAKSMGIKYLNDGEMGSEDGTRNHKLRFKPVMFLKSFDLIF